VYFSHAVLYPPRGTRHPADRLREIIRPDGDGPTRFSVQRKMAIVARLLRGEPLELVTPEAKVSIARLSEWRERALAGRLRSARSDGFSPQSCLARLRGEAFRNGSAGARYAAWAGDRRATHPMDNELLYAKIEALEGKRPLAHRRLRR
jgi:hypothetical protein